MSSRYLSSICGPTGLQSLAGEWAASRHRPGGHQVEQDLDYLSRAYDRPSDGLTVVTLRRDGDLVGVAPLVIGDALIPWEWPIAVRPSLRFAQHHLTQARFCGPRLDCADDPEVQQELFEAMLREVASADLLLFPRVDTASTLWSLTRDHPHLVDGGWRHWAPSNDQRAAYRVELQSSYEDYLHQRFTSKARYNMRREQRLLEAVCGSPLRLEVVTTPDRVEWFLGEADRAFVGSDAMVMREFAIARGAGYPRRLDIDAMRGQLQSYVLMAGDEPVAFLLGYRYGRHFLASTPAFAKKWAKHSPGTVMWNLVLEHLHRQGSVDVLDFGLMAKRFQTVFQNRSFLHSSVQLVRRRARTRVRLSPLEWHCKLRRSRAIGPALDRWLAPVRPIGAPCDLFAPDRIGHFMDATELPARRVHDFLGPDEHVRFSSLVKDLAVDGESDYASCPAVMLTDSRLIGLRLEPATPLSLPTFRLRSLSLDASDDVHSVVLGPDTCSVSTGTSHCWTITFFDEGGPASPRGLAEFRAELDRCPNRS